MEKILEAITRSIETTTEELLPAIQAVYLRDSEAKVTFTVSLSRFGDQQTDVQVDASVITNANEKPEWKPDKEVSRKRIRINDPQMKLPGV